MERKKALTMTQNLPLNALVPYEGASKNGNKHLPQRLRFWIETRDNQLELPLHDALMIGRQGKTVSVDVDLSPYDAHHKGISRQHAQIEISSGRVMLRDVGSVNGTRLNGKKLVPDYVYEIHDGDIVQLGMMAVRVFFVAIATKDLTM